MYDGIFKQGGARKRCPQSSLVASQDFSAIKWRPARKSQAAIDSKSHKYQV